MSQSLGAAPQSAGAAQAASGQTLDAAMLDALRQQGIDPTTLDDATLLAIEQEWQQSQSAGAQPQAAPAAPSGLSKYMLPIAGAGMAGAGMMLFKRGAARAADATAAAAVRQAVHLASVNAGAEGAAHLAAAAATRVKGGTGLKIFGGILGAAGVALAGLGILKAGKGFAPTPDQAAAAAQAQQAGGGQQAQQQQHQPSPMDAQLQQAQSENQQLLHQLSGDTTNAAASGVGQQQPAAAAGSAPSSGQAAPVGAAPGAGAAGPAAQIPSGQAAPTSLVGQSINLAAGVNAQGQQVADKGSFVIQQEIGSGFSSLDAANAQVRAAIANTQVGANTMRYAVIQTGNTFHAVIATSGNGPTLTAQQGTVVAWNSMTYVDDPNTGMGQWQAYGWDQQHGAVSGPATPGQNPFPQQQAPSATTAGGALPTGGVAPGAFDPSTSIGRTFDATTIGPNGAPITAAVQLQQTLPVQGNGFATADAAAAVAKQITAQTQVTDPTARVVTLQGADGKFYLYAAQLVAHDTAPLEQAAPVHIFGRGFATYFDGSTNAWQSVATR